MRRPVPTLSTAFYVLVGLTAPTTATGQSLTEATGPAAYAGAIGDSLVALLPEPLRADGRRVLQEPDPLERADRAEDLVDDLLGLLSERRTLVDPGALDFPLALLGRDPSPEVRGEVVSELADTPTPLILRALERVATADPDAAVSLQAMDELRTIRIRQVAALLDRRLDRALREDDRTGFDVLAPAEERYFALAEGVMLPGFMRQPPRPFETPVAGERIRVAAFGDFGTGDARQRQVAEALRAFHEERPFDFGITLGDNFYEDGMDGPDDPRWRTWWEDLYSPLGIPFYATLGNHDWNLPDSPAGEVAYSERSPSWRMPATFYTFTAGPVQFFALDTEGLSERQLRWLADALDASTARWKVVYGHHPVFAGGGAKDEEEMIQRLLPVIRDRADLYIAGHDHDMQRLRPVGRLHFFVAGSGGKLDSAERGPTTLFAEAARGFAVLEVDRDEVTVTFVDTELNELHEARIPHPDQ